MKTDQMKQIGQLIADILRHTEDETRLKATRGQVQALCDEFPLYPTTA